MSSPFWTFLAIGTTLANMVPIETLLTTDTIQIPPDGRVPLVGSVGKRVNGVLKRDGIMNGKWVTTCEQEELNAFLLARFGSYTRNSIPLYVSTIDESNHYSSYLCNFERPSTADGSATPAGGGTYLSPVTFNLTDCILQSVTKTSNYSVTTSDRFVYADTTSGSITLALPAVAGVTPYTVYSFIKLAAGNNLVLDPNSSEQIGGASTKTVTALNARVDIYTDGSNWFTV